MVFPSVPLYLDPPTTWNQQQQLALHHDQQQQQQQQPLGGGGGGDGGDHQQLVQQQPRQQNQLLRRGDGGASAAGSTSTGIPRPNSSADRAWLGKIPQPEQALKCPRCDSTNTKFCYFNNYSLSQPRHFCKTCRRYWTRGGALRNVPVGGGCRRNKRSGNKSSNKSSSTAEKAGGASSSSTATSTGTTSLPAPPQHLPFGMQSLHRNPLIDYGGPGISNIGLGFSSMLGMDSVDGSNMGLEQWRLNPIQQFPFLGGMEAQLPPPTALYSNFDGQNSGAPMTGSELITQLESVKMEDHNNQRGGMNLARQYLGGSGGINPRNDQFWGGSSGAAPGNNGVEGSSGAGVSAGGSGGGWMTNLLGFNSSSTGSLL